MGVNIAKAVDGAAISYELVGKIGAPKLVLIHSLALDRHVWDRVVERLKDDFSILLYDCRGHGASEKAPGPYDAFQFASDLKSVMDSADFERALIVGCSMGGCIAQAFASAYPHATTGLGLVDTTAWYGAEAPVQWRQRAARARTEGLASFIAFQTTRWFGDEFQAREKPLIDALNDTFLANDLDAYEATCLMLGDADLRGRLANYQGPAAIIVGDEDYATPLAMSVSLHEEIPGSTLQILQSARHLTPLERPDEVSDLVRNLAARAA